MAREIYPLTTQQIDYLFELIEHARSNNQATLVIHKRSMSSTVWDNSDYMVPYAIEDQILKECQRILFRKLAQNHARLISRINNQGELT